MIITWLCLFMITFNVCSEANKGEPNEPSKTQKPRLFKNYVVNYYNRLKNFLKKCPKELNRFLMWVKKSIKKGIKCFPHKKKHIMCTSLEKNPEKKKIPLKFWSKVPNFIRQRLNRGPETLPKESATKQQH